MNIIKLAEKEKISYIFKKTIPKYTKLSLQEKETSLETASNST